MDDKSILNINENSEENSEEKISIIDSIRVRELIKNKIDKNPYFIEYCKLINSKILNGIEIGLQQITFKKHIDPLFTKRILEILINEGYSIEYYDDFYEVEYYIVTLY